MSVTICIIDQPSLVLNTSEALTCEDACLQVCENLNIVPAASPLFGLRYSNNNSHLFASPSDLLSQLDCAIYDFRLRFLPALGKLSLIGSSALDYVYRQVKNDFVEGKVKAFDAKQLQDEALGLAVTAMYCQMQASRSPLKDILKNYKHFLPKTVLKNSGLLITSDCLKKNLKSVASNPPGEVWLCKKLFVEEVAKRDGEYFSELYPVKVEQLMDDESVSFTEYDLVIQPVTSENMLAGLKLQARKKKFVSTFISHW